MAVDPVSLAITAALTAANMALTAMNEYEGPRIKDTGATLADYGTPMNYLIGTRLIHTHCIFAKPIEEKKKKRKGKGGKQTEYTGFGTWAVHIADHEIDDVLQIWFDNNLVYNKTNGTEEIYPLADDYELDTSYRLYRGTETQAPDPDMQAFIEARDGPGTCPAYRDEAYAYFEKVPLEKIGNRFPDVKMLVSASRGKPAVSVVMDSSRAAGETYEEALSNGITVSGLDPEDVLLGNPKSSPIPAWNVTGVGTRWRNDFVVFYDGDSENYDIFGTQAEYTTAQAAADAFEDNVVLTGYSSYTFAILDFGGYADNQGKLTIDLNNAEGGTSTLAQLLNVLAETAEADPDAYDFTAATQLIPGYNWTQATGKQIAEAIADLYDVDLRPHDFKLVALPRGGATQGVIESAEFVKDDPLYKPSSSAPTDLPQKIDLTFADRIADQNPNTASPPGPDPAAANSAREISVDMSSLSLSPTVAQSMATRKLRRLRVGDTKAEFALTRRRIAIEPGDVWTPEFDDYPLTMRCLKTVLAADGRIDTEWERDLQEVAIEPDVAGAPAAGSKDPTIPQSVDSIGNVLDIALLDDAHEQSAPFTYLVAGPAQPGSWLGASFAASDIGEEGSFAEGWDGIADGDGSIIGEVSGVLPDVDPWVPDIGSSITVTLNYGELTAASLDDLLADEMLNLAAIQSGDGWELVQFMTPTLIGPRQYTVTGFLRGVRGTEWAMSGHANGDRFILLDTLKMKTLGASEIGDTDYYIVSSVGQAFDDGTSDPLTFAAAAHKPYAPVHSSQIQSVADLVFAATRRTRLGGANLDGQNVPIGQVSEAYELDILNGSNVVRTINSASLPITYTEAQQVADFGSAQSSVAARLYQMDPALNLRGYPLAYAA